MRLNSEIPAELEHIISRALEKDRELRYQHASDMRAELQLLQRRSPPQGLARNLCRVSGAAEQPASAKESTTPSKWLHHCEELVAQSMADLMQVITQLTNQGFFGTWTGQELSIRR